MNYPTYDLTLNQYQERSKATAVYPRIQISIDGGPLIDAPWLYPLLGLCGEVGEMVEKYKKLLRDAHGEMTEERKHAIREERGDALWYLARLASVDSTLENDAQVNLAKLASRKERGKLKGSGDTR